MSQEKSFFVYETLEKSIQLLKQELDISYLEAFAETLQNIVFDAKAQQIDGLPSDETCQQLEALYRLIKMDDVLPTDYRKAIQLIFLKGITEDAIQANHYVTPETIGRLISYFIQRLVKQDIYLLDVAAGIGNLVTLLIEDLGDRVKNATVVEVDEVLVSILAMSSQLQKQTLQIKHQDAVLPLLVEKASVVVSDLPIGFYPKDDVAKDFHVYVNNEHTYAHHLLMENALSNLADNGWGFFIVPYNVFETNQAPQLLALLTQHDYMMQAFLTLPKTLFKQASAQKAILIVQKTGDSAKKANHVLLGEIPSFKNPQAMQTFINDFNSWANQF